MALRKRNGTRARSYCFTLNNPSAEERDSLSSISCKFIAYGNELAPETGTPHLQGFVTFQNQKAFSAVKKLPGFARAHLEVMKGSHEQNMEYITKEDKNPYMRGEIPQPGKRNDIHRVVERICGGEDLDTMVTEPEVAAVFVKYSRGFTALQSKLIKPREDPPKILWLYGATGTGKTRCAYEFAADNGLSLWVSNSTLSWFDGYRGQPVALFDDYRPEKGTFNFILRLWDRYAIDVPIKGGFTKWVPKIIFITSPKCPRDTWSLRVEEDLQQLDRRMSHIIEVRDFGPTRRGVQGLLQSTVDKINAGLLGDNIGGGDVVISDSDADASESHSLD